MRTRLCLQITVSETRRAAIINWLVNAKGLMIYSHYEDERIERMWDEHAGDAMVRPVRMYVH